MSHVVILGSVWLWAVWFCAKKNGILYLTGASILDCLFVTTVDYQQADRCLSDETAPAFSMVPFGS
eukprot:4849525-Prymnesium_polylepis.2